MPAHSEIRHSPYTTQQIFDVVADIEQYPKFIPWVVATKIKQRNGTEVIADMLVRFKGISVSYTSRVELLPPSSEQGNGEITVYLEKGPFRHLHNRWVFEASENGGTDIHFELEFEFAVKLFEKMIGKVFEKAVTKMSESFEQRADALYKNNRPM